VSGSLTGARARARLRAWREAGAFASATIRFEQACLKRLLPRLGRPLARLRRADVEAWLARRLCEVRPATAARELSALRALCRLLLADRCLARDPTAGLVVQLGAPLQRVVTEQAVWRLLAEASRPQPSRRAVAIRAALALRDRAALELLYGLALRAGEVCGARLVDLDLAARALRVSRLKGGRPAILPLAPALVPHLERYVRVARPCLLAAPGRADGHLLLTVRGDPLRPAHLGRLVTRVARRAGVSAHPHALRRSLATHLTRAGASLPVVQALLGHQSLATTQRYVLLDQADLRAAVSLLERPG
jgi:site-specific recombinase XerD